VKQLVFAWMVLLSTLASAREAVIYSFQGGTDGAMPIGGLIADSHGNLYGVTEYGGTGPCAYNFTDQTGCGTVFELSPVGKGGWTESVIYSFRGEADGMLPQAGLTVDRQGDLYGTTGYDTPCPPTCGSVFKLSAVAGNWKFHVLHAFTGGKDGGSPGGGVVLDAAGNVFGTTRSFGAKGYGTLFQISRTLAGWRLRTIHAFDLGTDGGSPAGALVLGFDGAVYGTTQYGGNSVNGLTYGVLYKVFQNGRGNWKEKMLYSFHGGRDGGNPLFGLSSDPLGNLYGVTPRTIDSWGTAFEFVPNANGKWNHKILYHFHSPKEGPSDPDGTVILDPFGSVYGTTLNGEGAIGDGTVYELTPQSENTWSATPIYSFAGQGDGSHPIGQLLFDQSGNLYGVTTQGGGTGCANAGCGTVFEIAP